MSQLGQVGGLKVLAEQVTGDVALVAKRAAVAEGPAVLDHPVVPQRRLQGEPGATLLAPERALPRVRADVCRQIAPRPETLAAGLTGEWLCNIGSLLMRRHLVSRKAALKLKAEEALVTAELPLAALTPFPHFCPAFYRGALQHSRAVRQCHSVFPLVISQLLLTAKSVQAPFAAHFGRAICVRPDVVFEHRLTAKQASAGGALVTLAVPVHADVLRVRPGADEDARAVRALLLAHRAVLHPLVARQLPPVGELAGALVALEPAAVIPADVALQAPPVERGVVTLGAALP